MARPDFSIAAQLRRGHAIEWANGWQYGRVHRLADVSETDFPTEPPAEGDGWELNTDKPAEIVTPVWSDGSTVQQIVYWRRAVAERQNPAALVRPALVVVRRRKWWVGSGQTLADKPAGDDS
jgi:hypothetical protein